MAESVVSFLLPRLATLVETKVELLRGVGEEVKDIQSELQMIRAFLKDADAKSESNEGVKEWVKEVRDVAYEMEDVLDGLSLPNHYTTLDESHHGESHGSCIGSTKNVLQKMVDFCRCAKIEQQIKRLKVGHNVGTEIEAIKAKLIRISQRKERYNLSSSEQGSTSNTVSLPTLRDPREDALFLEEFQIVGIVGPRDKLITYLLEADPKLRVVSVYGMGGLGKTTLAKKVYDHQRLKYQFPLHRAWITVSQTYDVNDLLRRLIEELVGKLPGLDQMDVTVMKQRLNDMLRGKRYVVVLDDIWSSNAWKGLKNALPDANCGSRIIITTRFESIAAETCIGGSGLKYALEPLNSEDSRKLFYMKAFKSNVAEQFSSDLCSKFLKKCKGLPLGIVAIAGVLSTKQPSEWDQVYQSLGSLLDGSIGSQLDDLRLVMSYSFNDLPYQLKSCFLYMSIFPEDYSIKCSRLLRFWAAEGFVVVDGRSGMNFTKEELAGFYLDELIQRSLVQVETISDRKRVKSCKVHDLIREFIIGKASNENFATFTSESQKNDWSFPGQPPRRLSVDTEMLRGSIKSPSHIRSLFLFRVFPGFIDGFSRFKLLKVLYLEYRTPGHMRSLELLRGIDALANLRYLRLRCSIPELGLEMENFGTLFGKHEHLETLDLKGSYVNETAFSRILEMRQLRNLSVGGLSNKPGLVFPKGIHMLKKLIKLEVVDLGNENGSLHVSELQKMMHLRKLAVCGLRQEDEMQLFDSVGKMKFLTTFKVTSNLSHCEFINSGRLSSPPPSLQNLYMHGALNPLPPWISSLQNLEKLVLNDSRLKNDPMEDLQKLPSLVTLILYRAFDGEKLYITKGGFPYLKKLFLLKLENLNEVKVEEGAMPALETITHGGCKYVDIDELPLRIGHRPTPPQMIHTGYPFQFVKQYVD